MTNPMSSSAATRPKRDVVPGERHALARPHPIGHGGGVHGGAPASAANRSGEHIAAMAVVAKHVEARARGRQQHRVAGARGSARPRRPRPRASRRARSCTTPASAAASAGASLPISTTCRTLSLKACGERRKVLALALAAGDQHQRIPACRRPPPWSRRRSFPSSHRCSARPRCRRSRPSGAAAPGKLRARRAWRACGRPAASPSASAARALAALCRPVIFMRAVSSSGAPRRASRVCAPVAQQREIGIRRACDGKRDACAPAPRAAAGAHRRDERDRRRSAPRSRRARKCAPWRAHRRQPIA